MVRDYLGYIHCRGRRQPSKSVLLCAWGPSDYIILSYDVILMMTSYLVVTALVKLFVKIDY